MSAYSSSSFVSTAATAFGGAGGPQVEYADATEVVIQTVMDALEALLGPLMFTLSNRCLDEEARRALRSGVPSRAPLCVASFSQACSYLRRKKEDFGLSSLPLPLLRRSHAPAMTALAVMVALAGPAARTNALLGVLDCVALGATMEAHLARVLGLTSSKAVKIGVKSPQQKEQEGGSSSNGADGAFKKSKRDSASAILDSAGMTLQQAKAAKLAADDLLPRLCFVLVNAGSTATLRELARQRRQHMAAVNNTTLMTGTPNRSVMTPVSTPLKTAPASPASRAIAAGGRVLEGLTPGSVVAGDAGSFGLASPISPSALETAGASPAAHDRTFSSAPCSPSASRGSSRSSSVCSVLSTATLSKLAINRLPAQLLEMEDSLPDSKSSSEQGYSLALFRSAVSYILEIAAAASVEGIAGREAGRERQRSRRTSSVGSGAIPAASASGHGKGAGLLAAGGGKQPSSSAAAMTMTTAEAAAALSRARVTSATAAAAASSSSGGVGPSKNLQATLDTVA